jgi:hypothetical protein
MTDYELKPRPRDPEGHAPHPPTVLPYRSPFDRVHTNRLAALPAILGFFATLGVCAGAFYLFAATWEESRAVRCACLFGTLAVFIALALIRIPLQQRFGFSGFGRGMLIGTLLGMFALVPCAGFYTLTIVLF